MALLGISSDILWAQERQSIVSLVAIDLSAAFDTVDHDILLDILNNKFGVEDKALKWFDSYLRPHSYHVVIEGQSSRDINLTVSVPQGSCARANIFNLYCAPLKDIIPNHLTISRFADDHSIRDVFSTKDRQSEQRPKSEIEKCMLNIKKWMDQMCLKMNPSKTEFIYFGYPRQIQKCTESSINMAGDLIVRSECIKYLGAWLDSALNFKFHITKKCQCAMINFIWIRSIHHLLDQDTTTNLCLSLCISHVDYCNSILYGLPDVTLGKLQHLQNMCACLVLRRSKFESAKSCLHELHWLPVRERIKHKILTITYKCRHGDGPKYLQDLPIDKPTSRRGLRSSSKNQDLLLIPPTKHKTFADRSFSVAAPRLWNDLPINIKQVKNVLTFKRDLKTYLFKQAFC